MNMKEYVSDMRHLPDSLRQDLRQYAKELDVPDDILWADIVKNNKIERILEVDDVRILLNSYKKYTGISGFQDTIELIGQTMGMSNYAAAYSPKRKRKKKVWSQKLKQYVYK